LANRGQPPSGGGGGADTHRKVGVGTVLARRYTLVRKIATGAMSEVYQARQHSLDRDVAIKVLLRKSTDDKARYLERFEREARVLARLSHPNIVSLLDFGVARGHPFLVMEYIRGATLKAWARQKGISVSLALDVTEQLCRALAEAHRVGIVHRDIKHTNIFVCDDHAGEEVVRLVDFGIVQDQLDNADLTQAEVILGTPRYMAPEQATGSDVDGRTDLYSLGILMYWMLMGRTPFHRYSGTRALLAHIKRAPPPFEEVKPDSPIPAAVEWTVMRCLEKRKSDRFADAGELRSALRVCRLALARPDFPLELSLVDGRFVVGPPEVARVVEAWDGVGSV